MKRLFTTLLLVSLAACSQTPKKATNYGVIGTVGGAAAGAGAGAWIGSAMAHGDVAASAGLGAGIGAGTGLIAGLAYAQYEEGSELRANHEAILANDQLIAQNEVELAARRADLEEQIISQRFDRSKIIGKVYMGTTRAPMMR